MKIEQLTSHLYIKTPDAFELFLHDRIRHEVERIAPDDRQTIEYIAQEVLSIVNAQLSNQESGYGVLSVNGLTGQVMLSASSVGAKLDFAEKRAFNRDFGDRANTVCEGNDSRLSDARQPLPHSHVVEELNENSALTVFIERHDKVVQNERMRHAHDNKNVLDRVRYTGQRELIDLTVIDDFAAYLPSNAEGVVSHMNNTGLHVSDVERNAWNNKVSTTELTSAIKKSEENIGGLFNELRNGATSDPLSGEDYTTFYGVQQIIVTDKANLSQHMDDDDRHIDAHTQSLIDMIPSKSDHTHRHTEHLAFDISTTISLPFLDN